MKVINNAYVITMDAERHIYPKASLAIERNRIKEISEKNDSTLRYPNAEVIDAGGMLLLPGLINAHTHIFQILYKGLGDDAALYDWLWKCIYPMSLNLSAEDCYDAARLTALEMIQGGCTTFIDSHYVNIDLGCQDALAAAIEETGIRGVLGRASIDSAPAPERMRESITQAVSESERIIKQYQSAADGRISVRVEALNEKLASQELLEAIRAVSIENHVGMNMHIAEVEERTKELQEKCGMTSIEYAQSLGIAGKDVLLAHCCWLTEHDIDLIAQAGTHVAHNPVSNQYLADGIAPIPKMIAKGINVTAGPDGACSNNNQNMFDVMKSAALLHKVHDLDPISLTAQQALEMITINAAKAIGREDDLGSIEEGKIADLIIVDQFTPEMTPCFDPVSNLVYAATPHVVDSVMIDGRFVMKHRELKTLDPHIVIEKANQTAVQLAKKAGLI